MNEAPAPDSTRAEAVYDPDRPSPVLVVDGLGKAYGDAVVLDDVDLEVHAGEVHALLGENGAGKSTLIKIIAGVVTPDRGRVPVAGTDLPLRVAPRGDGRRVSRRCSRSWPRCPACRSLRTCSWADDRRRAGHRPVGRASTGHARGCSRASAQRSTSRGRRRSALPGRADDDRDRAGPLPRVAALLILDEPTAALTDAETAELFRGHPRAAGAWRRDPLCVAPPGRGASAREPVHDAAEWPSRRRRRHPGHDVRAVIGAMAGRPIDAMFPSWTSAGPGDLVLQAEGLVGRRIRDVVARCPGWARSWASPVSPARGAASCCASWAVRSVARGPDGCRLEGSAYPPRVARRDAHRGGVALVPAGAAVPGADCPTPSSATSTRTTIDRHGVRIGVCLARRERAHRPGAVGPLRTSAGTGSTRRCSRCRVATSRR